MCKASNRQKIFVKSRNKEDITKVEVRIPQREGYVTSMRDGKGVSITQKYGIITIVGLGI